MLRIFGQTSDEAVLPSTESVCLSKSLIPAGFAHRSMLHRSLPYIPYQLRIQLQSVGVAARIVRIPRRMRIKQPDSNYTLYASVEQPIPVCSFCSPLFVCSAVDSDDLHAERNILSRQFKSSLYDSGCSAAAGNFHAGNRDGLDVVS